MGVITIDSKDFLAGESTSEWNPDKGFSPSSFALNLTKERGILYFTETPTSRGGATLTGNPVAFCVDPALTGNDAHFVDDEGAFYKYNGTTLTKQYTDTTAGRVWQLGTTDVIPFAGNFYVSSQTTISQLSNGFVMNDTGWWETGLENAYRHPMEVVEGELFIGNLNLVHFYNGTSSGTAVTLPTGMNVTSLRRHPDGRTLLAFCGTTANFGHARNGTGRVYYIDPNIRDWTREVALDAQVEGTRVVGGTVYVTYGNNIGYFDGNGIQFLKKFVTSATTYSQSMGNIEDILLVRDGKDVLAFGDLGRGKVWWRAARLTTGSVVNCPFYKGDNVLLLGNTSGTSGGLDEIDLDNAGVFGQFFTNRILFPQESRIRRIDILHTPTNGSGLTDFDLIYRDSDDTATTFHSFSVTNESVNKLRIETDIKTDAFRLQLDPTTYALGFKQFRIFYEPLER